MYLYLCICVFLKICCRVGALLWTVGGNSPDFCWHPPSDREGEESMLDCSLKETCISDVVCNQAFKSHFFVTASASGGTKCFQKRHLRWMEHRGLCYSLKWGG